MIAVQTNDGLSIVTMSAGEFLESIAKDGINSSLVLAKRITNISQNSWVHLAKPLLPDITCCFRQVGDKFIISTNKIESIKDLEFFIAPDGKQYSCEEAFRLEDASKEVQEEKVEEKETKEEIPFIPNPVLSQKVDLIANPVVDSLQNEEEVVSPAQEQPEKAELMVVEEKVKESTEVAIQEPAPVAVREPVIEVKEEQKKAAGALDNVVRDLPSITSFPARFIKGIRKYITRMGEEYKSHAEQYLRKCGAFHENRENLKTNFDVPNAFGKSKDMLDSLAVFPVYSRILSKKNMDSRFVWNNIANSTFLRVCPIGLSEDETEIQCFVQEIKISSYDVKEAEEMIKYDLKKDNRKKRSLTPEEKYSLMEEALEKIYKRKKGSLLASRDTNLVEDLNSYIDKLVSERKVSYAPLYKWGQYDVVAYDVREKTDEFPTPLLAQLQNLNGKPFQKEEVVVGNPNVVKVPIVYTKSDKNAIMENSEKYVEVSRDVLDEQQRRSVVATKEGYLLENYYYDKDTGNMISGKEFLNYLHDKISESVGYSVDSEEMVSSGLFDSEEEEEELFDRFTARNITIGGTPISDVRENIGTDTSAYEETKEDIEPQEKLVDYLRPDGKGKYVDLDGKTYDSIDQWEIFKIIYGGDIEPDEETKTK